MNKVKTEGHSVKMLVNNHIIAEYQDMGLIDGEFVSRLNINGKDFFSRCQMEKRLNPLDGDKRGRVSDFKWYRYNFDIDTFRNMGFEMNKIIKKDEEL